MAARKEEDNADQAKDDTAKGAAEEEFNPARTCTLSCSWAACVCRDMR